MKEETLLELSQRDEAFWVGLGLMAAGAVSGEAIHAVVALSEWIHGVALSLVEIHLLTLPELVRPLTADLVGESFVPHLADVLLTLGALVLAVRLLVGVGSILRTAVLAWHAGRTRGRLGD